MVDIPPSSSSSASFLNPPRTLHSADYPPLATDRDQPMDKDEEAPPGEFCVITQAEVEVHEAEPGSKMAFSSEKRSLGLNQFGCSHYRRRCKIRSPCCNKVFDCRHCHNEAMNNNNCDPRSNHELPRHKVKSVICSLCREEQEVRQVCRNCGVCMGEYFCPKCKFFDDDTSKAQYHCDACGICRVGGKDKFFHCDRCACCYSITLKSGHSCVENSMHQNCPVCFDYLFDSVADITVMPCGHTIHSACLEAMYQHSQFTCPVCSKSIGDMSALWVQMDEDVALTPMPEEYRSKLVWILCNDCSAISQVHFHVVGQKCTGCGSYNTRQTKGGPSTSH